MHKKHPKVNVEGHQDHDPITTDQKFDNGTGIMTNAKPIAAQTGEAFPQPDPAPKIPWSESRFEWDSNNPGKGGEK